VLPVYLKLINPLVIDAQGGLWRGRVGRAVDDARSQGRDGVIIRNIRDSASSYATPNTTYIAFDEGQIKSALGNRGTYDPAERDMTFASRRRADGTLPIRPKTDLDPQQAQVQRELIEIVNDRGRADRAYNDLDDSHGGKVIGTDIARFLHPAYHSRRGRMRHTPSTSRPASAYAEDRLAREIGSPPDPRPGYTAPQLLMTAGGVASGKSTVITDDVVAAADLVSDGQMKNPAKAIATIEQALRNGWIVEVRYVHRPFDDAAASAVQRGLRSGRWGPLAELPALHMAAQRAVVAVERHFADDPRVTVLAWRNETGRQPVEIPVNALAEGGDARYTDVGELDATVQRQLDSQRPAPDADQLTHQLYQLIAQPAGPGLGPDQSQVDRLRAASGQQGAGQSDAQGPGQPAPDDLNPPDNRFASRRPRSPQGNRM